MVTDVSNKADRRPLDLSTPHIISIVNDLLARGLSVRIRVTGESMRPYLLGGEIVTLCRVHADTLRIGDLVLFVDNTNHLIMHRIIHRRIRKGTILLQTKGDGLGSPDAPLSADQVLGKVENITFHRKDNRTSLTDTINLNSPWRRAQSQVIAWCSLCRLYYYRLRRLLKTSLTRWKRYFISLL